MVTVTEEQAAQYLAAKLLAANGNVVPETVKEWRSIGRAMGYRLLEIETALPIRFAMYEDCVFVATVEAEEDTRRNMALALTKIMLRSCPHVGKAGQEAHARIAERVLDLVTNGNCHAEH